VVLYHDNSNKKWTKVVESKTESEFIITAHQYYNSMHQCGQTYTYSFKEYPKKKSDVSIVKWKKVTAKETQEELYKVGRLLSLLKMCFSEFVKELNSYYWVSPKYDFYPKNYDSRFGNYREGKKYRKNTNHKKKEKKQNNKEARRIQKGKHKDRKCYVCTRGKWIKDFTKRKHRAIEKSMLFYENWDGLSNNNISWKRAENPWNWD